MSFYFKVEVGKKERGGVEKWLKKKKIRLSLIVKTRLRTSSEGNRKRKERGGTFPAGKTGGLGSPQVRG